MSAPAGLTVGYVTGGSWTSRLIEWRSAGGPSHATTLVEPGWVIDAQLSGGVRRRPVSSFAGMAVEWYRVPATSAQVKATVAALASQIGKPYDVWDIFDFAFPSAFRRDWDDGRAWICSELQGYAEYKGGILPKLAVAEGNRLAPADMRRENLAIGAVTLAGPVLA